MNPSLRLCGGPEQAREQAWAETRRQNSYKDNSDILYNRISSVFSIV